MNPHEDPQSFTKAAHVGVPTVHEEGSASMPKSELRAI